MHSERGTAWSETPHGWEGAQLKREDTEYYEYAGFLVRLVASLIDGLVIGVVMMAMAMAVAIPMIFLLSAATDPNAASGAFTCVSCMVNVVALAVVWLYYAGFESSRFMGTPGKILMGIKVSDTDGNRISFGKATVRFVFKTVLNMFFYAGSLYILISDKKQGLYDVIANTLVIRTDQRS
jgi:uncharacterized RDD family membrane protein YckC